MGQVYATSPYRKLITKVEVLLNPLVGADAYLVRLDELNADNSIKTKLFTSQTRSAPFGAGVTARAFTFHDADGDLGVPIDESIRLGILISRLGDNSDSAVAAVHGAEVAAGPRKSYDDANVDFELENDVVYQHIDPAIGASTHSHGTDIRGNIKIFYTLILDHGNFVSGGEPGHSPRVDSGNAFPTTPTPVDNDIFIFDEDVASGLDWKDTDETTDLTAATAGDMARFDDPDWIKIINLVGGEVSALTVTETAPDLFLAPIEAVAVGGLGTTGVNKLALTAANAIVNRGGFTVVSATSNDALQVPEDGTYAIDFSLYMEDSTAATRSEIRAEIVVLRAGAEATDLRTPFARYYRDNVATDQFYISGSITLDLMADDQIQLLISEMANSAATFSTGANDSTISVVRLVGTPEVEGATQTGGQQSSTSVAPSRERSVISRVALTEFDLDTAWSQVNSLGFPFDPVERDLIDRIELGFRVETSFVIPVVLTRTMLDKMRSTSDAIPTGVMGSTIIQAAYLSFRDLTSADAREPIIIEPTYNWIQGRRQAGRSGILMAMAANADDDWYRINDIRIFRV